jgi:hypothetical protein
MPKHHHMVSDVCSYDSSSSEELYSHIRVPRHTRHGSVVSSHRHHHVHVPEPAYAQPNLAVPVVEVGGRKRASSTSGLPQPNIIINNTEGSNHSRSRSRERVRPRSRSRRRYYEDEDEIIYEERRGRVSRSPSPYHRYDYETRKALEQLKIYEQEKANEEAQKRYKAEMEVKKAKEQLEKAEAEAAKKEAAKKAVEDWQREQDAKKAKAKKEKEELDKKVEEQLREALARKGYSPSEIDAWIKKEEDDKRHVVHINEMKIARARPTYIKVHKKYLLPETLDVYQLPWSYDKVSVPLRSSNLAELTFNLGRQ